MDTSYNPFALNGKAILVTGSSSGIGQETAIQCSKLGAKVILTGRNEERLQETLGLLSGSGHEVVKAELSSAEDAAKFAEDITMIDGLALCSGRSFTAPFLFCDQGKYDEVFGVNFFAPVQLLRMLVKSKKLVKGGSVVFVSSTGGNQRYVNGNSIYGATKAALTATMRFCARELAPKKIRVNAVNPSMVNTPLVKKFQESLSPEQIAADVKHYPLGRYGEPIDIALAIVYLLSDASAWTTGTSLVIDGGSTI